MIARCTSFSSTTVSSHVACWLFRATDWWDRKPHTESERREREDREKERHSECTVEGNAGVLAGEDGRKGVKGTQWIMKGSKRLNRFIHRFRFILSLLLIISFVRFLFSQCIPVIVYCYTIRFTSFFSILAYFNYMRNTNLWSVKSTPLQYTFQIFFKCFSSFPLLSAGCSLTTLISCLCAENRYDRETKA